MILITGASGKTGRAVLRALTQRKQPVRVFVRRSEQAEQALAAGAAEAATGDLHDLEAVARAAQGCRAIYHICPNMSQDEQRLGDIAISAAKAAGLERFVYHSVLHPHVQEMPHHWNKLLVEERLFKSGLGYTILQPAAYMQNTLAQLQAVLRDGVYTMPYSTGTRLSMVDLEDVAAVAAAVLSEPGHTGATYELAGTESLSQDEAAAIFAAETGREVRAEVIPPDVWEARARAGGLGDYEVTTLLRMFRYYERYGFLGNGNVLAALLGREPTRFAQFVRRSLAAIN